MIRWTRRTASAVLAVATTALLAPATAAMAAPTTEDPVEAAAGWLANQLVDGERVETTFDGDTYPDQGLTADVVFALSGAGLAADEIAAATDWLEEQTGSYTGTDSDEVYAGSVAKLLIVADVTDRGTTFGGEDLVALLEGQEDEDGRFKDESTWGEFSNTITQSLAVIALERAAGTSPSPDAVDYLAGQACESGGFPEMLDAADCSGSIDATAFAVQAMTALGETGIAEDAAAWLVDRQGDDGSFDGDSPSNANSTGLAAVALEVAGETTAAEEARTFLLGLQEECDGDEPGSIRFTADDAGDRVRATAQALPGLTSSDLATVSAEGADAEAPLLDCAPDETAEEEQDTEENDPPDQDQATGEEEDETGDGTGDGDGTTTGDETSTGEETTTGDELEDGTDGDGTEATPEDRDDEVVTAEAGEELAATGGDLGILAGLAVALLAAGTLGLRMTSEARR